MLYDYRNVQPGATVCNLDTRERINKVVAIDTEAGEVEVTVEPLRIVDDSFVTQRLRFVAVWPILDLGIPCAFHCHGRLN
ncbi:MAG: hypothetical protein ACT6S0_04830 [Roseateles sp.]|uniref:hypothetical protein n=1 Tax=Roseateles sp. TaxID=1971397 RepID=UPI0040372872